MKKISLFFVSLMILLNLQEIFGVKDLQDVERSFKNEIWGDCADESVLLEKIKLARFHEVYDRIPISVLYFGIRRGVLEAIKAFKGEIRTWRQFARILIDHFRKTGNLELDEERMALFTFIQYFWRESQDDTILSQIAPELKILIELSGLTGGPAIKMMLKVLKCRNIDDYFNRYGNTSTGV